MRHDVPSTVHQLVLLPLRDEVSLHRLLCVCLSELSTVDLGHDLICHYLSHTKLVVSLTIVAAKLAHLIS